MYIYITYCCCPWAYLHPNRIAFPTPRYHDACGAVSWTFHLGFRKRGPMGSGSNNPFKTWVVFCWFIMIHDHFCWFIMIHDHFFLIHHDSWSFLPDSSWFMIKLCLSFNKLFAFGGTWTPQTYTTITMWSWTSFGVVTMWPYRKEVEWQPTT